MRLTVQQIALLTMLVLLIGCSTNPSGTYTGQTTEMDYELDFRRDGTILVKATPRFASAYARLSGMDASILETKELGKWVREGREIVILTEEERIEDLRFRQEGHDLIEMYSNERFTHKR